jgi:hypothetical protein
MLAYPGGVQVATVVPPSPTINEEPSKKFKIVLKKWVEEEEGEEGGENDMMINYGSLMEAEIIGSGKKRNRVNYAVEKVELGSEPSSAEGFYRNEYDQAVDVRKKRADSRHLAVIPAAELITKAEIVSSAYNVPEITEAIVVDNQISITPAVVVNESQYVEYLSNGEELSSSSSNGSFSNSSPFRTISPVKILIAKSVSPQRPFERQEDRVFAANDYTQEGFQFVKGVEGIRLQERQLSPHAEIQNAYEVVGETSAKLPENDTSFPDEQVLDLMDQLQIILLTNVQILEKMNSKIDRIANLEEIEEDSLLLESDDDLIEPEKPKAKKEYFCKYCSREFDTSRGLGIHTARTHKNKK